MIVSLTDYLRDSEGQRKDNYFYTQQLALRKMESEPSLQSVDELIEPSQSASH
jgi:hypothetical protein